MCFIRIRPEHGPLNPPGAAPTLMTIDQEHQYFAPPSQPGFNPSPSFSPSSLPGSQSLTKPGTLAPPSTTAKSASSSSTANSLSKPSTTGPQSPFSSSPLLSASPSQPAAKPPKKTKSTFFERKRQKESRMSEEVGARKGSTKIEQKVQVGINESLGMGAVVMGKDTLGEPVGEEGAVDLGIGVCDDHIRGKGAPTFVGVEEEEAVKSEAGGGVGAAKGSIGVAF